jgi:predicted nuclease of predicted toxin-antitoxin system
MKFLINECLTPRLAPVANDRGFEAYHVTHRGWGGLKDPQLLARLIDEELILVTNNRDDFVALVSGVELHPGLIVILENVRREKQIVLFAIALEVVRPMTSMINKVVEVSDGGSVDLYDLPPI